MSRHASMWMGAVGQEELLILLGALIVSSFAVLAFVRNAQSPRTHGQYGQAVWVWLGSLLVLWIYPERVIAGTAGHLLTVVLGTLFLYLPAAMLVSAWLPSSTPDTRNRRIGRQRRHLRYLHSAVAAAIGLVVGVVAFLGEMSEGGPAPPFAQLLFVGGVYLGLGMIGLLIGYASLGRLLGFVVDGPISDC